MDLTTLSDEKLFEIAGVNPAGKINSKKFESMSDDELARIAGVSLPAMNPGVERALKQEFSRQNLEYPKPEPYREKSKFESMSDDELAKIASVTLPKFTGAELPRPQIQNISEYKTKINPYDVTQGERGGNTVGTGIMESFASNILKPAAKPLLYGLKKAREYVYYPLIERPFSEVMSGDPTSGKEIQDKLSKIPKNINMFDQLKMVKQIMNNGRTYGDVAQNYWESGGLRGQFGDKTKTTEGTQAPEWYKALFTLSTVMLLEPWAIKQYAKLANVPHLLITREPTPDEIKYLDEKVLNPIRDGLYNKKFTIEKVGDGAVVETPNGSIPFDKEALNALGGEKFRVSKYFNIKDIKPSTAAPSPAMTANQIEGVAPVLKIAEKGIGGTFTPTKLSSIPELTKNLYADIAEVTTPEALNTIIKQVNSIPETSPDNQGMKNRLYSVIEKKIQKFNKLDELKQKISVGKKPVSDKEYIDKVFEQIKNVKTYNELKIVDKELSGNVDRLLKSTDNRVHDLFHALTDKQKTLENPPEKGQSTIHVRAEMPAQIEAKKIIESAGGRYEGIQKIPGMEDQAVITEPVSGSTTQIPLSEVTPENIKSNLERIKSKFAPVKGETHEDIQKILAEAKAEAERQKLTETIGNKNLESKSDEELATIAGVELKPQSKAPLLEEAKKFKTAEEFVKDNIISGEGEDTITLFHGTTAEGYKKIIETGRIDGHNYYGVPIGKKYVALSPNRSTALDYGDGKHVIEVEIPKDKLRVDNESVDYDDIDRALDDNKNVFAINNILIKSKSQLTTIWNEAQKGVQNDKENIAGTKKFLDYGKVHEAYKKGEIKANIPFKVKAYGGIEAKIIMLDKPYQINDLGQPIKYKIEEIKPLTPEVKEIPVENKFTIESIKANAPKKVNALRLKTIDGKQKTISIKDADVLKGIEKQIQSIQYGSIQFDNKQRPKWDTFKQVGNDLEAGKLSLEFLEHPAKVISSLGNLLQDVFYPEHDLSEDSANSAYNYKGNIEKILTQLELKLKPIASEISLMSKEKRFEFYDNVRSGQLDKLSPVEKQLFEIGNSMADKIWDMFVKIDPDMEQYRRDNHALLSLQWIFNAVEGEKNPIFFNPGKLEGYKGFLKKYSGKTTAEIKEENPNITLRESNPIKVMLTAANDELKTVEAWRMIREAISRGRWKYVPKGTRRPQGYDRVPDPLLKVSKKLLYPESVEGKEFVDEGIYQGLMKIAEKMGIPTPERVVEAGGRRLGYASRDGKTVTEHNTELGVLAHEIGHQLDFKYNLWDEIVKSAEGTQRRDIQKELRVLADLTGRPTYLARNKAEKIAQMIEAYVQAKEMMKEEAPHVFEAFNDFVVSNPMISDLAEIKHGIRYMGITYNIPVPKPVYIKSWKVVDDKGEIIAQFPQKEMADKYSEGQYKVQPVAITPNFEAAGEWVVPEAEARILNNLLSRNLISSNDFGKAVRDFKIAYTGIELMSGFHYVDLVAEGFSSRLALVIQQGLRGDFTDFGRTITNLKGVFDLRSMAIEYLRDPQGYLDNPENQKKLESWFGLDAPEMGKFIDKYFKAGGLLTQERDLRFGEQIVSGIQKIKKGDTYNVLVGGVQIPYDIFKYATQTLLFQKFLPSVKFSTWLFQHQYNLKQYKGQLERGLITEEELARRDVRSIDNRFGDLNWSNLWLNHTFKTSLQIAIRSYTYFTGTIKEMGTAGKRVKEQIEFIQDAIKHGEKPPVDPTISWFVSLYAVAALLASAIGYGVAEISGNKKLRPQQLLDFIYPKVSELTRIAMPGYAREPISFYMSAKKDPWHIPVSYFKYKMAGFFTKIAELRENKDFYKNKIWDINEPIQKNIVNFVKWAIPNIAFQSARTQLKEGAGIGAVLLSVMAFNKAPWWIDKSPALMRAYELIPKIDTGGRTFEQKEKFDFKTELTNYIRENDLPAFQQALKQGKITDKEAMEIIEKALSDRLRYAVSKLSAESAMEVYRLAGTDSLTGKDEKKQIKDVVAKKVINKIMSSAPAEKEKYKRMLKELVKPKK